MNLAELAELMRPVDQAMQAEKLAKGLYNVYQSSEGKSIITRDYADRTEQVRVNAATGQTRTIGRRAK